MNVFWKIIARLGLSSKAGSLELGEIGYDVDVRTFRVGDDTSTPPRIMSDKSNGAFNYPDIERVGFKNIELLPRTVSSGGTGGGESGEGGEANTGEGGETGESGEGGENFPGGESGEGGSGGEGAALRTEPGTIDGVTPSKINQTSGFLTRVGDNAFDAREINVDNNYLQIVNADGVFGNPFISISEELLRIINNAGGGNNFEFGNEPPEDKTVQPGDLFYDTVAEVVYLRLADAITADRHWWQDISSVIAAQASGMQYHYSEYPPDRPKLGDLWRDSSEDRTYRFTPNENEPIWLETAA